MITVTWTDDADFLLHDTVRGRMRTVYRSRNYFPPGTPIDVAVAWLLSQADLLEQEAEAFAKEGRER